MIKNVQIYKIQKDIAALKNSAKEVDGKFATVNQNILTLSKGKVNEGDVYTKNEVDTFLTSINERLSAIEDMLNTPLSESEMNGGDTFYD